MFKTNRKVQAVLWLSLAFVFGAQAQNASVSITARVEPLQLSKRQASGQDLSSSATAKSYEPPPEFYRGPGSTTGDSTAASFISKATGAFPTTGGLGSVGDGLSEAYNKWRQGGGLQERISVGHYGSGGSHAQSAHSVGNVGYAYEGHPYEYAHGGGGGIGSHYSGGGGGAYYGSSSAETGIPFDVYGTRPNLGPSHGHYAGAGGEYSHTYPIEGHHDLATHKGPPELSQKALLAKSFLIPLASAAVLGIAAALVSNPLLLQLGTVSGVGPTVIGKRKRRETRRPQIQRAYSGHQL